MTDMSKVLAAAQELARRDARRRLLKYDPYVWQRTFHVKGLDHEQRAIMAANRVGKTQAGGAEMAMHLTGKYPAWWGGMRFKGPIKAWAAGINNYKTRDSVQAVLLGDPMAPEQFGTGYIPFEDILDTVRFPGVPEAYSVVKVRHQSGGTSVLAFKSYEMGMMAFASEALDLIWLDEEPPRPIYTQCLLRVLDRRGRVYLTFTPEEGVTETVADFLYNLKPGMFLVQATWDDAPHLDEKAREQILAQLPPHEREFRRTGIPMLGSGLVWPIADERIVCDPFPIPDFWGRINGLDFGWDHPTACAFGAHDRDNDVFYLYGEYVQSQTLIPVHAEAIRSRGIDIPVAWPHDGETHDRGSGDGLALQYRRCGVKMLPSHFTNPPGLGQKEGQGGNAREPGVQAMLTAMETDKFKVFRTCTHFLQEKRMYHRKDGVIVPLKDDLISAARYAYQSRRHARSGVRGPRPAYAVGFDGTEIGS